MPNFYVIINFYYASVKKKLVNDIFFIGIDEIDYARYPGKDYQWSWLREYLTEFSAPEAVTERDIEQLYITVNKFALASHYFWTIWALIQAEHSTIDFDFMT